MPAVQNTFNLGTITNNTNNKNDVIPISKRFILLSLCKLVLVAIVSIACTDICISVIKPSGVSLSVLNPAAFNPTITILLVKSIFFVIKSLTLIVGIVLGSAKFILIIAFASGLITNCLFKYISFTPSCAVTTLYALPFITTLSVSNICAGTIP